MSEKQEKHLSETTKIIKKAAPDEIYLLMITKPITLNSFECLMHQTKMSPKTGIQGSNHKVTRELPIYGH